MARLVAIDWNDDGSIDVTEEFMMLDGRPVFMTGIGIPDELKMPTIEKRKRRVVDEEEKWALIRQARSVGWL